MAYLEYKNVRHGNLFFVDTETKEIIEIGHCDLSPARQELYESMIGFEVPYYVPVKYAGRIEIEEKRRKLTILNLLNACDIKCSNNYLKMHGGVMHRKKHERKRRCDIRNELGRR